MPFFDGADGTPAVRRRMQFDENGNPLGDGVQAPPAVAPQPDAAPAPPVETPAPTPDVAVNRVGPNRIRADRS